MVNLPSQLCDVYNYDCKLPANCTKLTFAIANFLQTARNLHLQLQAFLQTARDLHLQLQAFHLFPKKDL